MSEYCNRNGLTPSSLIKSLLQEEIEKRPPITSIYERIEENRSKIEENIQALIKLNLEVLYQTATSNFLLVNYIMDEMLNRFKGNIPTQHIKTFNTLKKIGDYSFQTLEEAEKALEAIGVTIKIKIEGDKP